MVSHRRVEKVVLALLGLVRLKSHLEMVPVAELVMHLVVVAAVTV